MIGVLVADDHPIIREGIKRILAGVPDIIVADEACSGPEVLEKVQGYRFDVVLLDIGMPGMDGLDILKRVVGRRPNVRVLMLSAFPGELYAIRALKAGAYGYMTKRSAPEELVKAIRRIAQGGRYITTSVAEKM